MLDKKYNFLLHPHIIGASPRAMSETSSPQSIVQNSPNEDASNTPQSTHTPEQNGASQQLQAVDDSANIDEQEKPFCITDQLPFQRRKHEEVSTQNIFQEYAIYCMRL